MLPPKTKLLNRAERLEASLLVEFVVDSQTTKGHCLNVSSSGALVSFSDPVDLWLVGELSIHFGKEVVTLSARVARGGGREAGLSFVFAGDEERAAVQALVNYVSEQRSPHGRPPF